MSVTPLSDGRSEATVLVGICDSKHFQFETREDAQELVDAEHVFKMLSYASERAECSNAQIHAAADAVLRAPCGESAELIDWTREKSRWIRSWTDEAQIHQ